MTNDLPEIRAGAPREHASVAADSTGVLDRELWVRRRDRRELELIEGLPQNVRALAPLVLALARLSAQRDAAAMAAHHAEARP